MSAANDRAIIEIHLAGQWVPAASVIRLVPNQCRVEYETSYIFSQNPAPLALSLPVQFFDLKSEYTDERISSASTRMPAFLYDLVPQGQGRQILSQITGVPASDLYDLDLLMAGACNPIGRLRLDSAVKLFQSHVNWQPNRADRFSLGWTLEEMDRRSDVFLSDLSTYGMLASGTTGVQGVAPKWLLIQDEDGLWHPDLALPDNKARSHWLVKMPRGRTREDQMVLRNEAAYLRVAQACGLRVQGGFFTRSDRLFVQRFDRTVDHDGVHRLHQESLASLAGLAGFAVPTSLNTLTAALRQYASDPTRETIEFIKRDLLNRALRNTDNHARNSAVQVLQDGIVQLTPLYDFAPMFKDPEVIARSVHWRDASGRITTDMRVALQALSEECRIDDQEQARIIDALAAWAPQIEHLATTAIDHGVDKEIIDACMGTIESVCRDLNQLRQLNQLGVLRPDSGHTAPTDLPSDMDQPRP